MRGRIPGVIRLGEDEEPDTSISCTPTPMPADDIVGTALSFLLRYDAQGNYIPDLATPVPTLPTAASAATARRSSLHCATASSGPTARRSTAADWLFT